MFYLFPKHFFTVPVIARCTDLQYHLSLHAVPVIARSHRPTRSFKSSHDRTDPVITWSDAQGSRSISRLERKRRTPYAISRLECKRRTTYAISLLECRRRTTCTISRFRAKDVHHTHKSPQLHKLYTYEISRLCEKVVFCTQSRTTYIHRQTWTFSTNQ